MYKEAYLKVTPEQRKVRRRLLQESYTMGAPPFGFANFSDGLYGNIDLFMEYIESGNCAADYDGLMAYQRDQFEQHILDFCDQYRNQIAIIHRPAEDVQESALSEEEPTTCN